MKGEKMYPLEKSEYRPGVKEVSDRVLESSRFEASFKSFVEAVLNGDSSALIGAEIEFLFSILQSIRRAETQLVDEMFDSEPSVIA